MARDLTFEIRSESPRRCQKFNEVQVIESAWNSRTAEMHDNYRQHAFLSGFIVTCLKKPYNGYHTTKYDLLIFNRGAPITVSDAYLLITKEFIKLKRPKICCDEEPMLADFFPGYRLCKVDNLFYFECPSAEEPRQYDYTI